jgi:ligand-binding sensor domain-containing protein
VRFDGVRFVPWIAPFGKSLPSLTIQSLLGSRDGGLWIGTAGGLAYWKDQQLVSYPDTAGRINAIVEDREGTVWIARSRVRNTKGPLCRVKGSAVRCYGESDGVPFPWAVALADDRVGGVWVGTTSGVCHWTPWSVYNYFPDNLKHASGSAGVEALALTNNGSLMVGIGQTGPGLGIRMLVQGEWKNYAVSVAAEAVLIDRDRGVWISTPDAGIYHVHGGEADGFRQADGLSSDSVESFFEDREGNVWTVSPRGIDRFRDIAVTTLSNREGLTADAAGSVFASRDGTVWIGNGGALVSLREGKIAAIRSGGKRVTSLYEDRARRVWVGLDSELTVREGNNFRPLRKADHTPLGMVVGLTEEADQNLWALTAGRPQKLFRIRDGQVRDEIVVPYPVIGGALAADPKEGIWLGFTDGNLARYRSGKFELLTDNDDSGPIKHLLVDSDSSVWAAAGKGLVHWKEGKRRKLSHSGGLPCDSLFSAVRDNAGTLWLYASCGVIAIPSGELEKWWAKPGTSVAASVLDIFDGAQPGSTPFSPPVSKSPDGRLWFTNDSTVQFIDPGRLPGKGMPPPVRIESILADQKTYLPEANLRLPAGTRNLQIDYTALSFVAPQKIQFRYKLENRDENWQQPGPRRQAFYTDLSPGRYRFRVMARDIWGNGSYNDNGVWNEAGASWTFLVEPAYYQTVWFRLLLIGACGFGLWGMYGLRVGQIAGELNARFDERVAERNRLSSELHDTFLQSVEASKMVADHALIEQPADPDHMRRAMETLSGWLAQATSDGRAALNTLRSSASLRNNLAEAFQRAAEVSRAAGSMEFLLSVEGLTRAIHPIVRDEVVRIGSDAIRNACLHLAKGTLEVKIRYAHDLTIRVHSIRMQDSGEAVVAAENLGHLDLAGMQDRAATIGGQVRVVNRQDSGTEIALRVPGRIAFLDARRWSFLAKLRDLWKPAARDRG